MPDYTTALHQARSVRALALQSQAEVQERNRTRLTAYRWLATQPQGQALLDDLALVLLKPCETPQDEGERRVVLKIFHAIQQANEVQDA